MNYQIIADETALREYIEWLPDLGEHEKFYSCLFARKKYANEIPWIKSDKGQVKRFLSDKDRLFDKIAQLECPVGAYKVNGMPIPQEALALYLSTNPRDCNKATIKSIVALATLYECKGPEMNPHAEVMSQIQKYPGKKSFVIFDLDSKEDSILQNSIALVDGYCDVVETRGGYHMFVHKNKIDKISDNRWYTKITDQPNCDQAGDLMSPPCGTIQGMHLVKFVYRCETSHKTEPE